MSAPADDKFITFYSYKGGTGRSMALANVAWVLASNGKRVLVIDWDLEAPGLHRYFHPFLEDKALTSTDGLIDFVTDFATEAMSPSEEPEANQPPDWYKDHADLLQYAVSLDWDFRAPGRLDFVPAGRQGPHYAPRVNSFNWRNFYDRLGGHAFLDAAKEQLRDKYDYILIDSRTGVSDTAGICTVQFPDAVVVCFTLNTQSIEGAFAAAESMDEQRRKEDGTPGVRIFPVPMRVESGEKDRIGAARRVSREKFARFLWHLSAEEREVYWSQVEVFHEAYYSFEEILATFADKPLDARNSLLVSIEQLTAYLTQQKVKSLQPAPEAIRREVLAQYVRKEPEPLPVSTETPSEYWFYLACSGLDYREQVEEFFRDLSTELRGLLGSSVAAGVLDAGAANSAERARQVGPAQSISRVFVPLCSPSYFNGEEEGRKFQYFLERAKGLEATPGPGVSPIMPVQWLPVERVPESAAPFIEEQKDFSEPYRRHGLLELMRRRDLRDAYQEFLTHFSRRLLEVARVRPLKVLPSLPLPSGQPNAFQKQAEGVFLSYSARDHEAVLHVCSELVTRGVTGMIRPDELTPGLPWTSSMNQMLAGASAAIVFFGKALSPWQRHELSVLSWREEQEKLANQPLRLISVLLPGARAEELPGFLLSRQSIDLRTNDPAALDLLAKALLQPVSPSTAASGLPPSSIEQEPYRGLLPFREEDARLFFGRVRSTQQLIEQLRTDSWITLLGASGSGKTSLVQAGLVPGLRQQYSDAVTLFTPGARPFHALAEALLVLSAGPSSSVDVLENTAGLGDRLAQTGDLASLLKTILRSGRYQRLVLIIDQFEELLVLASPPERRAFLQMLRAAHQAVPLYILVVLRADFYAQLSSSNELPSTSLGSTIALGGLDREELQQAIERPAALLGVQFEAGLVERLIEEAQGEPGGLPLLQFTLSSLWRGRPSGHRISHHTFERLGGLAGSLSLSAERAFRSLEPQDQERAGRLFLNLVHLQKNGPAILKSQAWDQLDEAGQRIAGTFIEARLLTKSQLPDGTWVLEAAHEVLFDRWPRLRQLFDEARPVDRQPKAGVIIDSSKPIRPQDIIGPQSSGAGTRVRKRGFSLIGVMVVVALVGLLVWVAGSYRNAIVGLLPSAGTKPMKVREDARSAAGVLTEPEDFDAIRRWIRSLVATGDIEEALAAPSYIQEPELKLDAALALAAALRAVGNQVQATKVLEAAPAPALPAQAMERVRRLARLSALRAAAGDEAGARNLGLEAFETAERLRLTERARAFDVITKNLAPQTLMDSALNPVAVQAVTSAANAFEQQTVFSLRSGEGTDTLFLLVSVMARLDEWAARKFLQGPAKKKLGLPPESSWEREFPVLYAELWLSLAETHPSPAKANELREALGRAMEALEKVEDPDLKRSISLRAVTAARRLPLPLEPVLEERLLQLARAQRVPAALLEVARMKFQIGKREEALSLAKEAVGVGKSLEDPDVYAHTLAAAASLIIQVSPSEFDVGQIQQLESPKNRDLVRASAARAFAAQNQLASALTLVGEIRDVESLSSARSAIARAQAQAGDHRAAYETAGQCVFPADRLDAYSFMLLKSWQALNPSTPPKLPWKEPDPLELPLPEQRSVP
jgi:MinD-like ATPase involved in chromosome partitioning or flagellar assembly/tetratricopeptide (TPR) repeat protein